MQCVIESAGTFVPSSAEPCLGFMLLTVAEAQNVTGQITAEGLAALGITPTSLGAAFIAGLGWIVVPTALAWCVALAVMMIRKA